MNKKTLWETAKFVIRMALLIGVPIGIAQVANLTGQWKTVFDVILPIILPIIDKWIHEDPRISANGIVPF
jgi:hypothetical protein